MNEHVLRFIEIFDASGILRPVFLTTFFNLITFEKPEHFAGVMRCAERAFREVEGMETSQKLKDMNAFLVRVK